VLQSGYRRFCLGSGTPVFSATILIRFRKGDPFHLHYKVKDVAAFVTSKAVKDFFGRTD